MTLYLKYRPQTFEDLDLTRVREALLKIVNSGSIPSALLFSGPKGLGKTSAARILAKAINCEHPSKSGEPCNKCKHCKAIEGGTHLDVIELDAASNRGIDDMRAIREAVKLAPAMSKKKVYIIDEAHMLTLEASNAVLKTLEEPPEHVMFILATTNPEKLIETIRSRATNVLFQKPDVSEMNRALDRVVKGEKIKITPEEIAKIIEISGNSFRDAVKYLEEFSIQGESFDFKNLMTSYEVLPLISAIFAKDAAAALTLIQNASSQGVSINAYSKSILSKIREAILANVGIGEGKLEGVELGDMIAFTKLLAKTFSQMRETPVEELPLEIAIIEWCGVVSTQSVVKKEEPKIITEPSEVPANDKDFRTTINTGTLATDLETETWAKILSAASPRNKSVEALLRSAHPINFDGHILTLGVFYSFHKERLEAQPHRQILDDIITEVFGPGVRVVCTLSAPPTRAVETIKATEGIVLTEPPAEVNAPLTTGDGDDIIKAAKEMFGG